jgi:hypothetical protein
MLARGLVLCEVIWIEKILGIIYTPPLVADRHFTMAESVVRIKYQD